MERAFYDRQWFWILFSLEENFWCYDNEKRKCRGHIFLRFYHIFCTNYYSSKTLNFPCDCLVTSVIYKFSVHTVVYTCAHIMCIVKRDLFVHMYCNIQPCAWSTGIFPNPQVLNQTIKSFYDKQELSPYIYIYVHHCDSINMPLFWKPVVVI